jgi:putative lipoic acid-binding regulatory protein
MTDTIQAYEFPCSLSIKAIGDDYDDYLQFVIDAVLDITGKVEVSEVTSRKSAGDKYLAVTIPFIAQNREQLEAVYQAINDDQRTKFVI